VQLCVINTLQISQVNFTVTISVKLLKAPHNDLLSVLVHFTGTGAEQLIVLNLAISICIEFIEQSAAFFLGNFDSKVAKALPELLDVQSATIVIVHDLENALHAENTSDTSLVQFLSKSLNELIIGMLDSSVAGT